MDLDGASDVADAPLILKIIVGLFIAINGLLIFRLVWNILRHFGYRKNTAFRRTKRHRDLVSLDPQTTVVRKNSGVSSSAKGRSVKRCAEGNSIYSLPTRESSEDSSGDEIHSGRVTKIVE